MILSLITGMLVIMTGISMTDAQGCPSDVNARCPSDLKKPWSFDPKLSNGPYFWSKDYPDCFANGLQSPIAINIKAVRFDLDNFEGLIVNGYDKELRKIIIKNTGYTVTAIPNDGIDRTVTVNDVDYSLQYIDLRIGNISQYNDNPSPGSDHRISGNRYEAELQFVHSTNDSNDGMVIISILLEANSVFGTFLDEIFPLEAIDEISYKGDTSFQNDTHGQLDVFVSPGTPYLSYNGSLSTPPCTPGVTWLILLKQQEISYQYVHIITSLYSVEKDDPNLDKCRLANSFRPPQDIAGREILRTCDRRCQKKD